MIEVRSVRRHGGVRVRARLLRSTALNPATRCTLSAGLVSMALLTAPAVLAQSLVGDSFGGRGGSLGNAGGAGGGPDQPGQPGTVSTVTYFTFGSYGEGSGGGGGGPSSFNIPQPGGAGGGPDAGGGPVAGTVNGGGAGGAGGIAGFGRGSGGFVPGTNYVGTQGAIGQASFRSQSENTSVSASGGGGAGGYGAILTGSGAFGTTARIVGGRGGSGGGVGYGAYGAVTAAGAGGDGGVGLRVLGQPSFTNALGAALVGGAGGDGGGLGPPAATAADGRMIGESDLAAATVRGGQGGRGGAGLSSNSSQGISNLGRIEGGTGGAGGSSQTSIRTGFIAPPYASGSGGAGGAGVTFQAAANLSNAGSVVGGTGGLGGIGLSVGFNDPDFLTSVLRSPYGPGGAGGAGGFGVAFAAGGAATNSGAVTGGAGGAGGAGSSTAYPGGAGGAGGDGLFSPAGLTLTNTGTIAGGSGGAGGSRGLAYAGADGVGGAGVRGAGLLIDNRGGTLVGGLAPDGLTRSPALVLTGGGNQITGGVLVGGLAVEGSAILQPALATLPVGTPLAVAGPVSFASGSTYQVRITPAAGDGLNATGTATLNGASVSVLAGQATYAPSTRYTILTAAGGLNGRFGTVFTNLAFLTPALSYEGANVVLTVTVAGTQPEPGNPSNPTNPTDPSGPGTPPTTLPDFRSVALTRNQAAAADGIQSLRAGNPVYDAVLSQSAAGARRAFDAASGEIHATTITTLVQTAFLVQETLLERMRFGAGSGVGPGLVGTGTIGQRFAPGTTLPAAYSADLPGRPPTLSPVPARFVQPQAYAVWGQGFGAFGSTRTDGNAATTTRQVGGFLLGAETGLPGLPGGALLGAWRAGVAAGYSYTGLDIPARPSTGTVESAYGAVYAHGPLGPLQVRLGAAYTGHAIDTQRLVQFPLFSDRATGRTGGDTVQGFGEVGYRIGTERGYLEPFAGGSALSIRRDGFTERGGPAALVVAARAYEVQTATVGVQGQVRLGTVLGGDLPVVARGLVGYRRAFGDVVPQALLAFASGGQGFTVAGVPVDRNAAVASAGLDWQAAAGTSIGLAYTGQIGPRAQDHGVRGNLRYTW